MYVSLDTLRRATQLIDSLSDPGQPENPAQIILAGVADLVGCDIATYNEIGNLPDHLGYYAAYPARSLDPASITVFQQHLHEHPLLLHYRAAGITDPTKISDFLSRQQFHRLGLYSEFFGRIPVEHQIAFSMPGSTDDRLVAIALNRSGADFTEADRALLSVLQAPLGHALRRSRAQGRARFALARAGAYDESDLTDRETQVLQLAAAGRTNQAIATAIDVSPRTIAKHLENIYRKLGVTSRAAAVYAVAGGGQDQRAASLTGATPARGPAVRAVESSVSTPPRPAPDRLVAKHAAAGPGGVTGQVDHGRPGRGPDRLGVHLLLRRRRPLQAVSLGHQRPAVPAQPDPGVGLVQQLAQDAGQADRAGRAAIGLDAAAAPPLADQYRCRVRGQQLPEPAVALHDERLGEGQAAQRRLAHAEDHVRRGVGGPQVIPAVVGDGDHPAASAVVGDVGGPFDQEPGRARADHGQPHRRAPASQLAHGVTGGEQPGGAGLPRLVADRHHQRDKIVEP
jgi:DNA-binding CsgD family transcriptional regulator